jgi:hypothetical protein
VAPVTEFQFAELACCLGVVPMCGAVGRQGLFQLLHGDALCRTGRQNQQSRKRRQNQSPHLSLLRLYPTALQ